MLLSLHCGQLIEASSHEKWRESILGVNRVTPHWVLFSKLELPELTVDDNTELLYRNLVAHEMCPGKKSRRLFTSFVCLLDSLIDNREDVRQLRKAHVIQNLLGSDKEVAMLFNRIATDLEEDSEHYGPVTRKIETHLNSVWKTSIAECYGAYFSKPWTVISLLAGIYMLVLESINTLQNTPCDTLCERIRRTV